MTRVPKPGPAAEHVPVARLLDSIRQYIDLPHPAVYDDLSARDSLLNARVNALRGVLSEAAEQPHSAPVTVPRSLARLAAIYPVSYAARAEEAP